jgi:hypothetical protein
MIVVACLIAGVWLMLPPVVTETVNRSGHGDLPDEGLGPFPDQTRMPYYVRPYEPPR